MRAKAIESIHEESNGTQTRKRYEFIATPETDDAKFHKHNIKIKHEMAEELKSMGLSRESINRILRLDVTEDKCKMVRSFRLRAKGKRGRGM